ncbi:MAG: VWA domain-containing protein [Terriglobales bacterium]
MAAVVAALLAATLAIRPALWAQSSSSSTSTSSSKPQTKTPEKPTQEAPAEAGGPTGDIGPIAVPKKKEEPPPEPTKRKPPEGLADYSMRVDVPLVNVDVMVMAKNGVFIPGLKKENFRVLEDGVPQKVTSFSQTEAPITAVLVVEFASINYQFTYDALNASYTFANSLKPNDWVAVVSYDMRPHMLVDFTQNKGEVYGALHQLRVPGFSETNVFDALYDTLDRLDRVEGRKYIILIGTGRDTFSKLTLDRALKKVKETPNVSIFTISTGWALLARADASGYMGPVTRLDFLQADNQMRTFASMTGGRWYQPRFEGELPDIFRDISNSIRNQYSIAYHPSNSKQDGTYRKIKVELVDENGGSLQINVNGKPAKVSIIAREGYTAKQQVE